MSEPVMWRTPVGRAEKKSRTPMSSSQSPLARTLSLCSVLSILLFAAVPAQAQSAAEPGVRHALESQKAASTLLLDIAYAEERLVAVGDRGHILYSDDGGSSWTQAKVPTRQLLTAVSFADEKHGWAVGHDALILATSDGGQTWTQQYENREGEVPLLDVWFENAQHGFATGAYGVLLETTDGQNWEDVTDRLDNEDGSHLNAIAEINGSGLFIVGEMGGMFRSPDMGETWERVESPYQGSFFGVVGGTEPGVVVAFGLRGNLFRSADFGDSWQAIELLDDGDAVESGLADGNRLPDGRIVVVGHGGTVLSSTDNGQSFKLFSRPDRRSLSGVVGNPDGNLVLVGQSGVRVVSPDGANLPVQQQ
jgi:photosystem II stability/assembly factor-like uncharacterized protein